MPWRLNPAQLCRRQGCRPARKRAVPGCRTCARPQTRRGVADECGRPRMWRATISIRHGGQMPFGRTPPIASPLPLAGSARPFRTCLLNRAPLRSLSRGPSVARSERQLPRSASTPEPQPVVEGTGPPRPPLGDMNVGPSRDNNTRFVGWASFARAPPNAKGPICSRIPRIRPAGTTPYRSVVRAP